VRNKAVYRALGVRRDGSREILGLWIETTEGAKFWMKVFNDLKTRGVDDILSALTACRCISPLRGLIAVTDGLTGMPAALKAVFPRTTLQTCIVHLIRNSLDYASWKDRKTLAAAPRPIFAAAGAEAALAALDVFADGEWGRKFPTVVAAPAVAGTSVAAGLGPGDSVLYLPAGDQAGDLHHQRDRERERAGAQDHQDTRPFSDRRRGEQTHPRLRKGKHGWRCATSRPIGARPRTTGRRR